MVCAFEQRKAVRSPVAWPVSLWHPKATRFFNGRSVDVSNTGVMVQMPIQTPLQEGQTVELNFPRSKPLAKRKGSFARIKNALVVRIDRSNTLGSATLNVGFAFTDQVETAPQTYPEYI